MDKETDEDINWQFAQEDDHELPSAAVIMARARRMYTKMQRQWLRAVEKEHKAAKKEGRAARYPSPPRFLLD